jgi:dimethylsulfone monooxygenase
MATTTRTNSLQSNPIFNGNKLKLGTFCWNTVANMTLVPENWRPTWANCLEAARLADAGGLEAIVPIARWKGYLDGRPEHPSNEVLDVFTCAAALAQATKYSSIFATSHAPTMHPVLVAKQCATIDAISGGRCSLNIVGGWNRREFDMFGIELMEHDRRYDYLADWLAILKRLWTDEGEFDLDTEFFHMKGAISHPHPVQKGGIPIMNAALSSVGIRFSAKNSDIGLITPIGHSPKEWVPQIAAYKKMAREEFGREIQIWTTASVVQREDKKDAEAFLRRYSAEMLDTEALDSIMRTISVENNIPIDSERLAFQRARMAIGAGYPLVGNAEHIASELVAISEAGINGVIMTWVDYIDGLKRFVPEVLPRLEQAGVRERFTPAAAPCE